MAADVVEFVSNHSTHPHHHLLGLQSPSGGPRNSNFHFYNQLQHPLLPSRLHFVHRPRCRRRRSRASVHAALIFPGQRGMGEAARTRHPELPRRLPRVVVVRVHDDSSRLPPEPSRGACGVGHSNTDDLPHVHITDGTERVSVNTGGERARGASAGQGTIGDNGGNRVGVGELGGGVGIDDCGERAVGKSVHQRWGGSGADDEGAAYNWSMRVSKLPANDQLWDSERKRKARGWGRDKLLRFLFGGCTGGRRSRLCMEARVCGSVLWAFSSSDCMCGLHLSSGIQDRLGKRISKSQRLGGKKSCIFAAAGPNSQMLRRRFWKVKIYTDDFDKTIVQITLLFHQVTLPVLLATN